MPSRWGALDILRHVSYKHLVAALSLGLALRSFFVFHFPFYAGDTKFYDELARNLLDHGVYGLFVRGQLTPVDMRMPGYPVFLSGLYAAFGRSSKAVMFFQAFIDLFSCVLTAVIAGLIAPTDSKIAGRNDSLVDGRALSVHCKLQCRAPDRGSLNISHNFICTGFFDSLYPIINNFSDEIA